MHEYDQFTTAILLVKPLGEQHFSGEVSQGAFDANRIYHLSL